MTETLWSISWPWRLASLLLAVLFLWMVVVEALRSYTLLHLPLIAVSPNLCLGYLLYALGVREPLVDTGSHFPFPHLFLPGSLLLVVVSLLLGTRFRGGAKS
jgi:hypothetical protein